MEYDTNNIPDMTDDELMHWGVRGMKWGVRRYQNKDGTLTSAGRKRYNAELAKVREQEKTIKNRTAVKNRLDRLAARKQAVEDAKRELDGDKKSLFKKKTSIVRDGKQEQPQRKKLSEMSDEELSNTIRRLQMENQYKSLTATPESKATVSKGDSFVKKFWNQSVSPAVQEAGKTLIRDKMLQIGKNKLGLNAKETEDYTSKLAKEVKRLNLEKSYRNLKEEAASAAKKTSETKAAEQLRQDLDDLASSGKKYTTSRLAKDRDWERFRKKYSWGVENYAMDEVND